MKTKNSDIAVKIFLVVVAVILVGLIIAWSTGVFKDKRKDLNEGTAKINSAISSMAEFDLLFYDGGSISGDALVKFIKTVNDKNPDLTIKVFTLDILGESPTTTPAAYSGTTPYPTSSPPKTESYYINPNGMFRGEVNRNDNDVITGVTFTQY